MDLLRRIILFIFIFGGFNSYSQNIIFDRPGVAETPYIPAKNHFHIELGEDFFQSEALEYKTQVPSFLLRFNILNAIDLRFQYGYSLYTFNWLQKVSKDSDPYAMSVKIPFYNTKDSSLSMAMLYNHKLGFSEFNSINNGHDFIFTAQKNFKRLSINVNLGYLEYWELDNYYLLATCFSSKVLPKVELFAEPYFY